MSTNASKFWRAKMHKNVQKWIKLFKNQWPNFGHQKYMKLLKCFSFSISLGFPDFVWIDEWENLVEFSDWKRYVKFMIHSLWNIDENGVICRSFEELNERNTTKYCKISQNINSSISKRTFFIWFSNIHDMVHKCFFGVFSSFWEKEQKRRKMNRYFQANWNDPILTNFPIEIYENNANSKRCKKWQKGFSLNLTKSIQRL